MSKFASVVVSRAHPNIDKVYQYSIPDPLVQKIEVGSQVLVPFGSGKDIGYVVGFSETAEVAKLKDVIRVTSEVPLFNKPP
jgi:primosomal protein N' (replication factor Y)